jgi:hypothetical protein
VALEYRDQYDSSIGPGQRPAAHEIVDEWGNLSEDENAGHGFVSQVSDEVVDKLFKIG